MNLTADLTGDGRKNIKPNQSAYRVPMILAPISLANCKRVIKGFLDKGHSTHNIPSSTGWIIEEYCALNHIPLSIEFSDKDIDIRYAVYKLEQNKDEAHHINCGKD